MALNVISQLAGVTAKLNTIVKICKYKKLHEGDHFILMAMEVQCTPRCDMDHFMKRHTHLFHDKRSRGHLSLYFGIQFSRQRVNIAF
jgi:hypothetical protein